MLRFLYPTLGLSLLVLVIFFTGCGGDDDDSGGSGSGNDEPPVIFFRAGDDLISSNDTLFDDSFSVSVDVDMGGAELSSLRILENNTAVPASNLVFNRGAVVSQNPLTISDDDRSGTLYIIEITPINFVPNQTSTYTVTVTDEEERTASASLDIVYGEASPPPPMAPPVIFLASGDDVISFDSEIPVDQESFFVRVDASVGSALLQSLTITENDVTIPPTQLVYDAGNTTAQNPFLIVGDAASGSVYDIEISPSNRVANTTSAFVFTVSDLEGMTASVTLNITYTADPATVTLEGVGIANGGDRLITDASFQLEVAAAAGTFDLSLIAVYENGILLPAENVSTVNTINGSLTPFVSNPAPVNDGIVFVGTIQIDPVSPAVGLRTYTIEFIDTEGGLANSTFNVNFVEPQAPVDILTGVLFNAAGPAGTGGLDLDTGNGTGSSDVTAEIRDEGIDASLPVETNWRQQISAVNGTVIVSIDAGGEPDFNFDDVFGYQQVIDAFNSGVVFTGSSEVIEPGDIFGALRDGNYYLIRIAEVNVVVVPIGSPGNNSDNYVIDIIKEAD